MSFAESGRTLRMALFALALVACDVGGGGGGDLGGDGGQTAGQDAGTPFTQVFTIHQPTSPGLQQLINECASGFDRAACHAMCLGAICSFGTPDVHIYACSLSRSGPIATVTVTFDGPVGCPGLPPTSLPH